MGDAKKHGGLMSKGPKKLYAVTIALSFEVEVEARSWEEAEALSKDRLARATMEDLDIEDVATEELEDVTDEYDQLDEESQEQADAEDDFDPAESAVRVLGEIVEENDAAVRALSKSALN
jgi:hypothetical protein